LKSFSATKGVVNDVSGIYREGGRAAVDSWGRGHAEIARRLRAEQVPNAMVRKVAHSRLLVDLVDELRELWPGL
jgi:hypothetical protein